MNSGCFFPFSLCVFLLSFALSSCFLGVRVESQIPGVIGSGKDIDTDQPSRSNPEKRLLKRLITKIRILKI